VLKTREKAAATPNLAAKIIGGISFFQSGFDSTIMRRIEATAVNTKHAVRAFLGPIAYWIAPLTTQASASARELTTVFKNTFPGIYLR